MGATGGSVHAATSFVPYIGNRQFKASWGWWYALRAFIGASLALLLYVAFRAGFSAAHQTATIACVHGVIGGHGKCLARGEYCAQRFERQYERYGFTCTKLDRRGRWHLQ
jgi:hypothetical protein